MYDDNIDADPHNTCIATGSINQLNENVTANDSDNENCYTLGEQLIM